MQVDPTTKFGSEYFGCECHSDEHTLRFTFDTEPDAGEPELYTSILLESEMPWYKRIVAATKYVFGYYKCKYGHFGCWSLKPCDVDRMLEMLNRFKETEQHYKNRIDKSPDGQ
jgi:hypothetical protein